MATLTKNESERLLKSIKKHTGGWSKEYFANNEKQSVKAKRLSKLLNDLTLGKTDKSALAKIFSEVSGEIVEVEAEEDVELKPLVALVLTKLNTTDAKHNYATQKVIISVGD